MSAALSLLLVGAALLFVAWPFLRGAREPEPESERSLSPLEKKKLEALSAIKEAEFDLRMGKLSDADFHALTERYRRDALEAIAALEEARSANARKAGERAVRAGARVNFCPDCGEKVTARANFCGACGRSLQEAVA